MNNIIKNLVFCADKFIKKSKKENFTREQRKQMCLPYISMMTQIISLFFNQYGNDIQIYIKHDDIKIHVSKYHGALYAAIAMIQLVKDRRGDVTDELK
jgi:hypothetical protein